MPELKGNDPGSERLLLLYEEQARLRAEIESLKNGKNEEKEEKGDKENKQDETGKEDTEGKDGKDGEEEKDKKEKKPPLWQRAGAWVREHPIATLLIGVGVLVLLIAGFFVWRYLESYESTDDAEIDGHTSPISSRIQGRVVAVYTEDNRSVVKEQTLVDLDPRDYEVALAQARANLAQAQAALAAAAPNVPITQTTEQTNVETAELEVSSAEAALLAARQNYDAAVADLRQAEANEANAAAEEARYRALVDEQEVSREIYDQRATNLKALRATVEARRASADAARKTVDQRQAAVDEARKRAAEVRQNLPRQIAVQHSTVVTRQANAQAAAAQVEQALLNLSYCKIGAPAGGIIGNKTVEVGMDVSPGEELMAITPIDGIWVTADFKETQIRNMHPGQPVTIHVDALSQDFSGYVQNMPGATGAKYSLLPPENATGNYVKVVQRLPIRIRFRSGQQFMDRLRPGMSVEPKVWVR